jgi:malonyl-CoA decarboxylase
LLPAGKAVAADDPQRELLKLVGDSAAFPPPSAREALEGLAAWYLTREWREGHALDSVARFHLGNGARLERVNWLADTSAKGIAQSFGLMVNYVYDLGDVERNHEEYMNRHRVVASSAVERLAKQVEALLDPRPSPLPT